MRASVALMAGGAALGLATACDFSSSEPQTVYPDQESHAFQVYARNCSGCHVPPLPDAHSAIEWPGIIARMQQHRMESRMPAITPQAELTVRDYLAAHATTE